jgi:microcystin degradation protein MlrC
VHRILRESVRPKMTLVQLPLLTLPPMQCTLRDPMKSILEKAHAIEAQPKIINVSIASGFPFSDIKDAGVAVIVTADGDEQLARSKARELARHIWERRDEFNVRLTPVHEAIDYARRARGLVVLADGSDNPGGGAPCDGTVILRELVAQKVEKSAVICIVDPETVARAASIGVGNEGDFVIGAKTDKLHGEPLPLRAHVRMRFPCARMSAC